MIKRIKEWIDKRKEKKLLSWIASHDIRYEKYKYFYGDMVSIDLTNIYLSNIDDYIYEFIDNGGRLVYAYDSNVYEKVKELKQQNIPYCFTENEYETKLNYLIEKKEYVLEISGIHRIPYYINEMEDKKVFLNNILDRDIKYLWVGSKTLEKDVEEYKNKKYKFTIQENLVKEIDYGL